MAHPFHGAQVVRHNANQFANDVDKQTFMVF